MLTFEEITIYIVNTLPCPQIDIFCGIMMTIGVLFVGALLALFANLISFTRERYQLHRLERLLEMTEGNTETFSRRFFSNPNINTLVYERVELVYRVMGHKNIALNLSELSDLTFSRNEAQFKNQLVNFVIAVLLIIGLAGTFWAFRDILTNSEISEAISKESLDLNLYKEAINKIYKGFQHAFLASLAGIMGTVVLLLIKYLLVNPLRDTFFYQLDWVTQSRLIPLFTKPNLHDQVTERLLTTSTKFETTVTQLQSCSKDMRENVAHAKDLATELNQLSLNVKEMATLFQHNTSTQSPFYQAATQLYDAVNLSQHHYERLGEGLSELINQNRELLGQHHEQAEQLKVAQNNFVRIHHQVSKYLEQVSTNFDRVTQQHLASTQTVTQELQDLLAAVKAQQVDYTGEFEQLVRRIKESALTMAEATQQLQNFVERVNEHTNETIPQLSKIGFGGFLLRLEEYERTVAGQLATQTQKILVQLNQVDSLQRIERTLADLPKHDYTTEMRELIKVLTDIQESLKKKTWLERLGMRK